MNPPCRALTAQDYAGAAPLFAALPAGGSALAGAAAEQAFARLISHPGTTVMARFAGGRPVAMASLHLLPGLTYGGAPYGVVENVVTLPGHRGQGHARQVMQALIETAWGAGAYKIMLLTGRDNAAAGFYEKLGFDAAEKTGMILRRP
jgi:GNAT superfamily N-acetyltransferase